ncbi:MAG: R3H domain-containing nucleic acid-binding protein [Dehalococcoidales bacterium]
MPKLITDDLDALLAVLPPHVRQPLNKQEDLSELLEIVLDLGRPPEARFPRRELVLDPQDVTRADIDYVTSRVSSFGDDNRAGIERTLHRISAIRNRKGNIIGLSLRVGRAVFGTIKIIEDLVESGKSVLLLGRPGIGKTTMLREVARVLADSLRKRVVIVDTSNEIAGDGDIPHPAIGHARRMQVTTPARQHAVMIEAVENHMPEVIVIDEIGTELEAQAARTIAERGVQLVGTAHGNTLDNLMVNPTLSDLLGGIQAVTLGDEEARRRGTQKTILERKAPPTFDIVVEIQDRDRVAIHPDVVAAVDAALRGRTAAMETRWRDEKGEVVIEKATAGAAAGATARHPAKRRDMPRLFLFGINRHRFEQQSRELKITPNIADKMADADLLLTSKNYYRRRPQKIRDAEAANLPVYVLKNHTPAQFRQFLNTIHPIDEATPSQPDSLRDALREAERAVSQISSGEEMVELSPQSAYIRRLQHLIAQRSDLSSVSHGQEPVRRVSIHREETGA